MMQQVLAPGMEDGEEADLRSEVFGIGGDGGERPRAGFKQQVVDGLLILQRELAEDRAG
jgi:hypothetical protein